MLRKSSSGWNIVFLLLSGGLLAFVIFRFFRKKRQENQVIPSTLEDFPAEPDNYVYKLTEPTRREIINWFIQEEQLSYVKYPDAGGFSIGIGHFIKPNEGYLLNKTLTQEEVYDLFDGDLKWVLAAINKHVKVPLNKNQKLALMSFVFNIGEPRFSTSTLLKKLNVYNYTAAALEFPNWRISEGKINPVLVERRKREQSLFSKPV